EYLIKNITKDKKRLAATAQLYIAQGLYEIIKRHHADIKCPASEASFGHLMSQQSIFLAGGIANNKIISSFFESKPARNASRSDAGGGAYKNRKAPVGDAGLSFGQIFYHLLSK
ncbi:MAG TPA: hypothetical protein DIT25_02590, partial [Candidatus Moranbacteria bacterium]|nr:hypothetical protein [Candidatus Moranbacteria bacterium]